MNARHANQNSGVIAGALLILLGIVFLLTTAGVFGLDWGNFWPIFLTIGGICFLVPAFLTDHPDKRAGWVIPGVMLILISAFFFATTLEIGITWSDQGTLWPLYTIIFGLALLAGYAASGGRNIATLATGAVMTGIGIILLVLTRAGWLSSLVDSLSSTFSFMKDWGWAEPLNTWWPLLLVVVGLVLVGIALMPATRVKSAPVLVGSMLLMLGIFFQATTLGAISWEDQGRLWPLYPIIFGLALLASTVASRKDRHI